jgi:predicted ATPase
LLAELLSLPNSAADLNLSPQGKRQKLFEALVHQLESLARGRPVLMIFEDAHQLTAGDTDDGLRLQAHHSAWGTLIYAGEPARAREHSEAGRQLYDPERHRSHSLLYGGHDPGVCAGCTGAQAHWLLGYPEKSLAIGGEALELAERITHPFSLVTALLNTAMLHLDRREPELALRRLGSAEAHAAEQRVGFVWEPRFLRGVSLSAQGDFDEAVACFRSGLAGRLGMTRSRVYGLRGLAEALTRQNEHEAALATASDGLKAQEQTGHRMWEVELLRLAGIALFRLNRLEQAEGAFEEALRIAQRQHAKAYELRAAMALAQLWGEQGRRTGAHDLLAPVYNWFTEGFDTPDLKEANALLDELG